MKRILLLVTVALMLASAMALSGVAQAAPTIDTKADARCLAEAAKTVEEPGFNPSNYTFHGGTENIDNFSNPNQATAGPDAFCGFGGDDSIDTLDDGDIFLGGTGNDLVGESDGTVYGQEGNDVVRQNDGTFNGGEGNDSVFLTNNGTFFGGTGIDYVHTNIGTFNGQEGDDIVDFNNGIFNGGEDNDFVLDNEGTFNGGPGDDTVGTGNPPVDGSP